MAKDALHRQAFPSLAHLSGLGLVRPIHTVGGLLEQPANQGIGGLENRRAHQNFQLGDGAALRLLRLKAGNQSLDFFFLGQA
jgi:hypothetical protein